MLESDTTDLPGLFLAGATGAEIRAFDWATSSLGDTESWPEALRSSLATMLSSPQPMFMAWGPELVSFFNDAYRPILGRNVVGAIGRPFAQLWADVWPEIEPIVQRALAGDGSSFANMPLTMERNGYPEPTWWSFTYMPIRDGLGSVQGMLCTTSETTAEVQAVNALRQSEERHRRLLQQMPGFVAVLTGPDHVFDYVNDAYVAIAGPRDFIGRTVREVFPEIEGQGYFERLDEVFATGEPSAAKGMPVRLAGDETERFIDHMFQPIRRDDGAITGIFVGGYDVTDRVRGEKHRDALVRLGDVLRNIGDPDDLVFAATELLGRTMGLSRVGYASIDHVKETLIVERDWTAEGVESLAGITHLREYGSFIDAMKRGESVVIADVRLDARTAGHASRLEERSARSFVNASVIEQGKLVATFFVNCAEVRAWCERDLSLIQDFAERTRVAVERARSDRAARQATDALQALNATLEHQVAQRSAELDRVWRNAQDLQFVIDADGVLLAVSPSAVRLLGWTPEEMVGHSLFAFTEAEGHQASREALRQAAQESLPPHRNRYRHKDGTRRTISWITTPEDGLIYCYGRDVTVETEQARNLLQTEEALRQAQKMEAIGQLTGGVAHDFNNLLTVIKSSSDLLKRPNLAEERRVRYIGAISDTVDRAAKLTGQLLAFARRQALKPEVFAATDSVRGLADMMGTLTGSRVQITTELSETPCYVNADASQFDTALVNLAVNARDAMDGEGKIAIAVRVVDGIPAIRSHAAVTGPYVAVSISDTGSGIPPDVVDRIFEPFFTTKEVGKGTGLGLSQVFGFAKQSGGDIHVQSEVGKGTAFTFYMPRVAVPDRAEATGEQDMLVDGQGTRVLVVEDNIDVGTFAVQSLNDLGYSTTLAADGIAALAELEQGADRFDVVFSDVMMPGMSGIELGQEIRRQYHDLPVVLTSGYSHVLAQNGTFGFELLHKPYSVEQLSQMLRKAASGQRCNRLMSQKR